VGATIGTVSGFSAHADYQEAMRWLDGLAKPPSRVYCVHGEAAGLQAMKQRIINRGPEWKAEVAGYLQKVELG